MQGDAAGTMAAAGVEQGILQTGGVAHATLNINNTGTENRRPRTLMEALDFPARGYRENTVENAHGHTCEWLLQNKQYRAWVASRNSNGPKYRLLWIKGKAGSGKSTLMKFALKNSRGKPEARSAQQVAAGGILGSSITYLRNMFGKQQLQEKPQDLVFSHFFNARGQGQLEKSAEGMYRTLLIQMLKRIPGLQEHLDHVQEAWVPSKGLSWPIPKLEELLDTAVKNLEGRPIVFYVDALDECEKREIRQMVRIFANLIKKAASFEQTVRVCFASRPYPDHNTRGAVYLDLSRVQEHKQDIAAYVDSYLQIGKDSVARRARRRLPLMAEGVFLWVKLVVEKLNDEYSAGRPDRYVRWLSGAHGELRLLYKDMLERGISDADEVADNYNKQAAIVCFQVVLFQEHNVPPRGLVHAIEQALYGESGNRSPIWRTTDIETIMRYVSSASQGLLECVRTAQFFSVQFIHESAREFMLSKDGLAKLLDLELLEDLDLHGHEMIRTICDKTLSRALLDQPQMARFLEWEWEARIAENNRDYRASRIVRDPNEYPDQKRFLEEHPMLEYARRYALMHADAVQRHKNNKQNQGLWLSQFYERHGHSPMNRMWQYYDRDIIGSASLIDFMVTRQVDALMRASKPLLLQDIRQGRQRRCAPGIWLGAGPYREWTYVGLRSTPGLERHEASTTECLVDLYLEEVEQTARPGAVQEVLQNLADTWSLERGTPSRWSDESGITLADVSDDLALFFLIALAPTSALNNSAVEAVTENASAGFAEVMLVFLERGIETDFLVLDNPHIAPSYLHWAKSRGHFALAASLRSRGIGKTTETWLILSWSSGRSSNVSSEASTGSQASDDSSERSIDSLGT